MLSTKLTVALACVRDLFRNGVTYCGEIFHVDPCRTHVAHGLDLISIGSRADVESSCVW